MRFKGIFITAVVWALISGCAFLVRTEGRQILFDAANGAEDSRLMPVLDSLGTAPEDIDYVFITHLHGDHTGGLLKDNADAYDGRILTFMPEDSLPCGVKAVAAYGHTPGHTIYLLGDILIAGDIMHGVALQREHPEFSARFDMDSEAAVNSRKAVLQMASEGNLKVYGMHFPAPYHL